MRKYFVRYPRGFVNEYTVFVVESPDDEARLRKAFPDAFRITRKRAMQLGFVLPRRAEREGEQWFGGFAEPQKGFRTYDDRVESAIVGTRDLIEDAEMAAEMAAHFHDPL